MTSLEKIKNYIENYNARCEAVGELSNIETIVATREYERDIKHPVVMTECQGSHYIYIIDSANNVIGTVIPYLMEKIIKGEV